MRLLALKIDNKYFKKILVGEKTIEYRKKYRQPIDLVETVALINNVPFPGIIFAELSRSEVVKLKDIPLPERDDLRKYYKHVHDNTDFHALHLKNVGLLPGGEY